MINSILRNRSLNLWFNKTTWVFLLVLSLSSCMMYTPQVSPPITVNKKGECDLNFGASVASLYFTPGVNANLTYGITDKWYTQVYASALINKNPHAQILGGRKLISNPRFNLYLSGGYFYGTVHLKQVHSTLWTSSTEYKNGNYQSNFGKLQVTTPITNKLNLGIMLTVGNLKPNILIEKGGITYYITQKEIIYEPNLYFQYDLTDKIGLIFSYSYCAMDKITSGKNYIQNDSRIDYNYFGNIGFTVRNRILSK